MDFLKADMVKLATKKAKSTLAHDERVRAAFIAQPEGSFHTQALVHGTARGLGGALGGAIGSALIDRPDGGEAPTGADPTVGSSFPGGPVFVALTDRRLLVFERRSMTDRNPGRLLAEWPAAVLVGAERGGARLGKLPLTLRFGDGSEVVLDAGSMQRFGELDAAIAEGVARG